MRCCDCGHELKGNNSALKCVNKNCQRNVNTIIPLELNNNLSENIADLINQVAILEKENEELKNRVSNFIYYLIDNFPEVATSIINKEGE